MKNKKTIIGIVCAVVVIIIFCIICIVAKNINNNSEKFGVNDQGKLMYEPNNDIDFNNVEVSTIKFKLKNNLENNISKVYIRDNTESNFSREICKEIKVGEEAEVEYGNYSPVFIWDMKIVLENGEEKTLNTLLAANILYDGATLDLTALDDNIEAVNNNISSLEEGTEGETPEGETNETENQEGEEQNADETVEEENSEVSEEVKEDIVEEN